jgi:hypothetical protein
MRGLSFGTLYEKENTTQRVRTLCVVWCFTFLNGQMKVARCANPEWDPRKASLGPREQPNPGLESPTQGNFFRDFLALENNCQLRLLHALHVFSGLGVDAKDVAWINKKGSIHGCA